MLQVHGTRVHTVGSPGGVQGAEGDALVTDRPGTALAVFTADCAPVAFSSDEGVVGIAHAGWRGLEAGVLEATVDAMAALGARRIRAALGPCIQPGCYAFGVADLAGLVERFGPGVRSQTTGGEPALDLVTALTVALAARSVAVDTSASACTACSGSYFSHRARHDPHRQASLVVLW